MTYALVVPEEQLANLVLIRKITKESIRSLIITAIEERNKKIIEGITLVHGAGFVSKLSKELTDSYANRHK